MTKRKVLIILVTLTLNTIAYSQVTIGSLDSPHSSAVLEIKSSNKGVLGPRVILESQTDQFTIAKPAVGLLVYNLGTGGLAYTGYVFWNGFEWRSFNNSSVSPGIVGTITCNGVSAMPSTYQKGKPYVGTMMVPYTGGNGGVYPAQKIGPINGLTATLPGGNFNVGSGTLAYTVTGIPTISSPLLTSFPVSIGGKLCTATIGGGDGIAPGELLYYRAKLNASVSGWMSDYVNDLPIIGGKLRIDAWFYNSSNVGNGVVTMNPRLVNISASPVKLWFSAMTTVDRFNAGNYLMAAAGYVDLDNGIYYGYGYNDMQGTTTPRAGGVGQNAHQEVVTVDLSLDDKWYRIYYFPIVDNMNTVTPADNERKIYLSIQRLY